MFIKGEENKKEKQRKERIKGKRSAILGTSYNGIMWY